MHGIFINKSKQIINTGRIMQSQSHHYKQGTDGNADKTAFQKELFELMAKKNQENA